MPFFCPCEAISTRGTREPPHRGAKTAQRGRQGAESTPRADPLPFGVRQRCERGVESGFFGGAADTDAPTTAEDGRPHQKMRNQGRQTEPGAAAPIYRRGWRRPRSERRIDYRAKPLTYNGRLAGGPRDDSKAAAELPPAQRAGGAGAAARHNDCGWAVRRFEEPPGSPVPPAGRFRGGTDKGSPPAGKWAASWAPRRPTTPTGFHAGGRGRRRASGGVERSIF